MAAELRPLPFAFELLLRVWYRLAGRGRAQGTAGQLEPVDRALPSVYRSRPVVPPREAGAGELTVEDLRRELGRAGPGGDALRRAGVEAMVLPGTGRAARG